MLDSFFAASPATQALWILIIIVGLAIMVIAPVFLADWLSSRSEVRRILVQREAQRLAAEQANRPAPPTPHRRPTQGLAPLGPSMFEPARVYAPSPLLPTPQTAPQPEESAVTAEPTPLPPPPTIAATEPPDRLMVDPPEVELDGETVTLFEWARRTRGEEGARSLFQEIVAEFYVALLTDQRVASYFPGRENISTLRSHFANALVILSRDGLWLSTANHLSRAHKDVRNERGEPITPEVFDIVTGHLLHLLAEIKYNVPNTPECLGRLTQMVGLAKSVIAVEPEPEPV